MRPWPVARLSVLCRRRCPGRGVPQKQRAPPPLAVGARYCLRWGLRANRALSPHCLSRSLLAGYRPALPLSEPTVACARRRRAATANVPNSPAMPRPRIANPASCEPEPSDVGADTPSAEAEREPAEPNPLHRSPTALRADGLAPPLLGVTELAKTAWPPRRVTPAVLPCKRAANRSEATPNAGAEPTWPDPAREPLRCCTVPELRCPVAPLVPRVPRVVPPTEPTVGLPEPVDPDTGAEPPPVEGAGAVEPDGAGAVEGAGAGDGDGDGDGDGAGAGAGAVEPDGAGVEGMPTPTPEQAQARLAPATVTANDVSTAKNEKRMCRFINQLLSAQPVSVMYPNRSVPTLASTKGLDKYMRQTFRFPRDPACGAAFSALPEPFVCAAAP